MRYRQLSPTGDYTFGQGQLNFLTDSPAAVAQVVETYLKLWLGEWYLNVNDGTPWLEEIMGYHQDSKETADQALIGVILQLPGVVDVNNWQSEYDAATRSYTSISATLDTIYGQTALEVQNLGSL